MNMTGKIYGGIDNQVIAPYNAHIMGRISSFLGGEPGAHKWEFVQKNSFLGYKISHLQHTSTKLWSNYGLQLTR